MPSVRIFGPITWSCELGQMTYYRTPAYRGNFWVNLGRGGGSCGRCRQSETFNDRSGELGLFSLTTLKQHNQTPLSQVPQRCCFPSFSSIANCTNVYFTTFFVQVPWGLVALSLKVRLQASLFLPCICINNCFVPFAIDSCVEQTKI